MPQSPHCSTVWNPKGWSPAIAAISLLSIAPQSPPRKFASGGFRNLVDKLYQGEPGLLVLHLLKSHPLDAGQAKEVRAVLDEMTGGNSKKKTR